MDAPTLPFGTAMALAERNLRGPLLQILTEEDFELARLAALGLIEDGDELLRLTPAGAERYASVSDRIGTATRRVFSLFDATQVETARTLLQQIAETDPATIAAIAFDEAPA